MKLKRRSFYFILLLLFFKDVHDVDIDIIIISDPPVYDKNKKVC